MHSPTVPSEGQILTGSLFHEPMRVETVAATGAAGWTLGLVGTQSERFRRVSSDHLLLLTATPHKGDPDTSRSSCSCSIATPTPTSAPSGRPWTL